MFIVHEIWVKFKVVLVEGTKGTLAALEELRVHIISTLA